jgi:uncharacterized Zn finger protein
MQIMAHKVQPIKAADDRWSKLTWDDLHDSLGGRTLAKGKSYRRRVSELVQEGGRLLAWVTGRSRYATLVELTGRKKLQLQSVCSCPIGGGCKHAAAVAQVYLEALKEGNSVPAATQADPRWAIAQGEAVDDADEIEAELDRDESSTRGAASEQLVKFLEAKSKDDLVAFALQLVEQMPQVSTAILEKLALEEGDAPKLIARARRMIDELTAEPAWSNHWTGEGSIPDYSHLRRLLESLLNAGQADALLELGKRLMTRGQAQVEQSHDEGETAGEVIGCLNIIFKAVPLARLADVDKLLYVLDLELQDGFDLTQGAEVVWKRRWPKSVWSEVADALKMRVDAAPAPTEDWHSRYQRDRLTGTLISALDDAGRNVEATALAMSEAKRTGSYERVVQRLIAERRWDEARQWTLEGIAQVDPQSAGIIDNLRRQLAEIAKVQKDWPTVAAERAEEYFASPSVQGLNELVKAAHKAGCGDAVETAALRFLETAKRPDRAKKSDKSWPLPVLPEPRPDPRAAQWPARETPHYDVLIDLAISQKDMDAALRWYDLWQQAKHGSHGRPSQYDDRIASAVAQTHPEHALAIRLRQVNQHILSSSYDAAGKLLRAVRPLLERLKRADDWPKLIAKLRAENRRRRNFMAVLDRLEKKPIVGK